MRPMPAPRHLIAALALCQALPAPADGAAYAPPEWLPLVPAGEIVGRDGRTWTNADPAALVAGAALPIPVDLNHATHLAAPGGGAADAQGWVEALEVRDGAVWGRIAWTPAGAAALNGRAYRYYSPAFLFDPDTRVVSGLASVGLTNNPNLSLPALNHSAEVHPVPSPLSSIAAALALDSAADEATCLAEIGRLKTALNAAAMPPLDKWVPRADYDLALNARTQAEADLAAHRAAEHAKQVDAAIADALTARVITPATEGYHRQACATPDGLNAFRTFAKSAPVVLGAGPDVSGQPAGAKTGAVGLNARQQHIARSLGLTDEQYAAELARRTQEAA